jgi:hypothetical protein
MGNEENPLIMKTYASWIAAVSHIHMDLHNQENAGVP